MADDKTTTPQQEPQPDKRAIDTSKWYRPDVMDLDGPNCLLVDVPQDYKANILVIRYPVVTESEGGIIYDYRSHQSPKCLGFVIKSSTFPIERGDTVLVPEHVYEGLEISLIDQRAYAIDVRDVVLLYPDPKNPLEKRQPPKGQDDGD